MSQTPFAIDWFEIPVRDMDRAVAFFNSVFQLELQPMETPDGPIMTFQVDGVPRGMLARGDHNQPSESGPLVYFASPDDIDDCLKRVEAAGGQVHLPKTPIGPYGFIAYFRDTEGNRLALHTM